MIIAFFIFVTILAAIGVIFYKYGAPMLLDSTGSESYSISPNKGSAREYGHWGDGPHHLGTVLEYGLWGDDPFHSGSVADEESRRTMRSMEEGPMNAPLDEL